MRERWTPAAALAFTEGYAAKLVAFYGAEESYAKRATESARRYRAELESAGLVARAAKAA